MSTVVATLGTGLSVVGLAADNTGTGRCVCKTALLLEGIVFSFILECADIEMVLLITEETTDTVDTLLV